VRTALIYPFDAPDWKDLRVGFFLSVTDDTADDTITGLAEIYPYAAGNGSDKYPWIGVKSNTDSLPGQGQFDAFVGYSNSLVGDVEGSELVTSDEAIGVTNANFWRPRTLIVGGVPNDQFSAVIVDQGGLRAPPFSGVQPHFPQNTTGAGGYATLLMLRLTRPNPTSPSLTVSIKQGTNSSDVLHTNAPTLDLLATNLANYPGTVQTKTVNTMADPLEALYVYWPFMNSRIRIHCLGFLQFS
jgi:hypothetical protein